MNSKKNQVDPMVDMLYAIVITIVGIILTFLMVVIYKSFI